MNRNRIHLPLLILCLLAVVAPPATAATGDYSVSIPGTDGVPGWTGYRSGGPYRLADGFIGTAIGSYAAGSYEIRRLHVPDATVRIMGGRIAGRINTPQNGFVARVRVGTESGAMRTLLDTTDSQMFDVSLAGDNSWVDFGLSTTTAVTTTAVDANYVDMRTLTLSLHDAADPRLALDQPDTTRWYGAQCVWVGASAYDSGAGVWSVDIANATTGQAFDAWRAPARVGLQPGVPAIGRGVCIDGGRAAHGSNTIRVATSDAAARGAEMSFVLRFDRVAPTITPNVADGATFDGPHPVLYADVTDGDSGVASVSLLVDGRAVTATSDRNRYAPDLGTGLAPGRHTFEARASDAVGNANSLKRTITIRDVTPPTIALTAPGASGDATPWLEASATDSQSQIDTSSWIAAVDGQPLPLPVATSTLRAAIGMLTAGPHAVEVSVADTAGNRAHVSRTYTVTTTDPAAIAVALGGRSAIALGDTPQGSVQYGAPVRIAAVAVRTGRPLQGDRLVASMDGAQIADAMSDAHGVAVLGFRAVRSGVVTIALSDGSLEPVTYQLRVAPRIVLAAASRLPRRGRAVSITGRVLPLMRGRSVQLEARIEDAWYPLRRSITLDRRGRFHTTVTSAVPGQIAIRVRLRAQGEVWADATSNVVVLRVRADRAARPHRGRRARHRHGRRHNPSR